MADVNSSSPGFLNPTFKEELEEAYDDLEDHIEIKHEPKYAEVMQESFFENDYLSSNTSETESLENLSTNKSSENSGNMIIPLRIKSEKEEDCVLDKITPPNHYVVNSPERLQENVTESLASSIHSTWLAAGDNSESNIDASIKKYQNDLSASNEIDNCLNTKSIDVCNELILKKNRLKFSCLECSYVTRWRSVIQSHIRSHLSFKNSSCDGCNFESTPVALRHHQYKCKSSLLKNILPQRQENKDNRNLSCSSCPKCSYVTKCTSNLEPHFKSHTKFKNLSCDGCNFKSTPIALRYHQYKCESYLLKNPLSQREENKRNRIRTHFSCPECSFVTTSVSNFKPHVKSHRYFETSSCDGCDFKSTAQALRYHQYKCEAYLLKNRLSQHRTNETKINLPRFSCPECSYVTTSSANLKPHMKSHIKFKNASCDGCNFKSTPMALRNHQYKCESYLKKTLCPDVKKIEIYNI